ncbi:hypothetical protein CONLIGDRAFT_635467 [Coniochaeta ligniaria NRRL 30616]|uniref:Uncharacterized protein n=1 Tax=Coniochaeta ligniaria NRRL 30616 TaxID=1408157 RepID=A0A1J7IDU6_9PEZI|nr:hypothetical protein CONLIGDRAFT_635467 [Coniochaeta ligniaria NRRL 30616]
MRPSRPVTAGLLLAALALLPSFSRGRAVDREVIAALTSNGTECLGDFPCVKKRAFPKFGEDGEGVGAAAGHGEGGSSAGGTAQVGGVAGSTEGIGSGSTVEIGGTSGTDQRGHADTDSDDSAGVVPPEDLDPFANPAPGAALPAGRVPGQNVLPRDIPDYVGLEEGTAGRAAYQRFLNYDLQGSRLAPPNARYLFFSEQEARNVRMQFKNEFNQGLHRELLGPNDQGQLIDVTDIYTTDGIPVDRWQVPAGTEDWFQSAELSLGTAQRAAQDGGTVHVIGPSMEAKNNVLNTASIFNKYELWILSNGEGTSKVDQILLRNAKNINLPPVVIWTSGEGPIGTKPEFIVGPTKEGEEGREIDMDVNP